MGRINGEGLLATPGVPGPINEDKKRLGISATGTGAMGDLYTVAAACVFLSRPMNYRAGIERCKLLQVYVEAGERNFILLEEEFIPSEDV